MPAPLLLLLAGIVALAVPTLTSLAREYWGTDNGVHGPLLLVSGVWLIWRSRSILRVRADLPAVGWLLLALVPLLVIYVYGRAMSVLFVESFALYLLLVTLAFYYWGPQVMRQLWFPALYLAFLVRPPAGMVAEFTQPVKIWISQAATDLLQAADYPIAHSGVKIQIAQYELLVQQACAGLGSIFSLLAIGLLYLHLASPSRGWKRLFLLASIIPLAVVANLLRVILLILITVHFGEAAAQGISHEATGILTFALSLLGLYLLDQLVTRRTPEQVLT
ncbi:MAG TPA: exosortase [Sphingomicrobium sp.]|nr:exosortase [Sphingomicrobium sp.]